MDYNKEFFHSPRIIFLIYVLLASLLIMAYRFIFPGEAAPLFIFSRNWRLIRGVLDLFTLFPALVFSALVVPFGIANSEDYYTSFSPHFFQRLIHPVIIAICSAVVYVLIFFLLLPLARDYEENMRYKGELYRLAKERAQNHGKAGEWLEVSQFIGICDGIWPDSPELTSLRAELDIHLEENRFALEDEKAGARAELLPGQSAPVSGLPGQRQPLNAAEAIVMGEAALAERQFFDAHWFATLAGRIAKNGSPESVNAARLAARAWNQIESQGPNRLETRLHELYLVKQSGYQAMVSGDWIRGFYIFQELSALTPDDPDARNFLAICEKGIKEIAFFIDEIEVSLGEILTGAVFSIPAGSGGRAVLRFASLSASPDFAYGIGLEYMRFDANSRLIQSLRAPYAKLLPFSLGGKHQIAVQMRTLDRHNQNLRWEPEWNTPGTEEWHSGEAQIALDIGYETFLLLSKVRRGLPNLQIGELLAASQESGAVGYVLQVFQAEIFNRLGTALFFLPMAIVSIIIGWRFHAQRRPRYLFFPLLPILPIVFNGMAHLYRSTLNTVGIWLILVLGFSVAFIVFVLILAASLVVSLIILAAQHG